MRCFFMNFKENLKNLMNERNLKNVELANKAGLTRASISYYLLGKREPNLEALEKLKNALACSYDDLLK